MYTNVVLNFFCRSAWLAVACSVLAFAPPRTPNLADTARTLAWKSKRYGRLPLLWGHEVAYTTEAVAFMLALQQQNYPFHTTAIGLGLDGFPEQHLSPLRIDPQLVEAIEAEKGKLTKQLKKLLRPEDMGIDYPYTLLINPPYVLKNYGLKNMKVMTEALRLRAFHRVLENNQHGTKVVSLILGDAPVGASVTGKLTHLLLTTHNPDTYLLGTAPDIINFSTAAGDVYAHDSEIDDMELFHQLQSLSEETIFVLASGNDGTTFNCKDALYSACQPHSVIVVGSTSPTGHASDFSNYGEQITILAGGEFLPTPDQHGEIVRIEGSSFAAPQVTAALANVIAFLPSLTGEEAQHMLKITATPTAASNTGIDGAGVLNHYLLLRAAHRIAQAAERSDKSVHELIFTDTMYDFRAEAAELAKDGLATLGRDAFATIIDDHLSFTEVKARLFVNMARTSPASLTHLRRAAALDPTNTELRQQLAAMYSKSGYDALSMFYGNPRDPATVGLESPMISFLRANDSQEFIRENFKAELVSQYLLPLANKRIFSLDQNSAWRDFFANPYTFAARYVADQQTLGEVFTTLLQAKHDLEPTPRLRLDLDYERRMKRAFPAQGGEQLNLVEWAILHRHKNLLEHAYEKIETELDDIVWHKVEMKEKNYPPTQKEQLVAEVTAYILFTLQRSNDADTLHELLHLRSYITEGQEAEFLHSLQKDNQHLLHNKPGLLKILQAHITALDN